MDTDHDGDDSQGVSIKQSELVPSTSGILKNESMATDSSTNGGANDTETQGATETVNKKAKGASIFHVDTSRIHAVPVSEQASELQDLGVSVFNQDEFEQGVLAQVDQAICAEEAQLARRRDEKELQTVQDSIRTCQQELKHLQKAQANIRIPAGSSASSREVQRKLQTIKKQTENKTKQLKRLKAKRKYLAKPLLGDIEDADFGDLSDEGGAEGGSASVYEKLLSGGASSDATPGPSRAKETEHERLVRLGEMTPFGTSLTLSESSEKPKSKTIKPTIITDFEKFLGEKNVELYKKHKMASKWKGSSKAKLKGSSSGSNDGSLLHSLLTPKVEPPSGEVAQGSSESQKRDADRPGARATKDGKKTERKRLEFEPKHYKKVKKKWDRGASASQRKAAMARDLTENWDSDGEMFDDGDEEYIPDRDSEDEAYFDDDANSEEEQVPGRRFARPKKRKLVEAVQDGTITSLSDLKRRARIRSKKAWESRQGKVQDDSSQEQYARRLKEHKRRELREKEAKMAKRERLGDGEGDGDSSSISDSEEEDVDLDGGFKIPARIWKRLYRYQKIGVKWLWELHRQKAGGIIGDEMGLGKTIQIIAFLAGLRTSRLLNKGFSYRGLGPVLIVCPATVLHQWVKEFQTWYPEMRVAVLHESGSFSGKKKEYLVRDMVKGHGVLITSFSNVRLRQELLLQFNWHYVILDEGHKIRNPDAEITLACKQFRTPHRLILTGSPMQNNLRELWSLIDFVFPGKLGTLPVFMQQFSVPIIQGGYANASKVQVQTAYKCACILRDTISPYLLRRLKADVRHSLQLPSKNEQVLFCHLTEDQTQVYEDYLASKECNLILRGEYQVFAGLITLRKICNHPDLVSGGPKIYSHQNLADDDLTEDQRFGYWKRSGKMIVVESLLKLWKKQNHRVLLFSQSKQMLDIMEDYVKDYYTYMRMDGTTSIGSRQPLINKFNSDPNIFLFLLTTRVGGLGVNLTGANRVVIFDPDWNPSTDTQARERSWRIGQKRQVTIYRLLTAGTIEEKIYHRQIFKQFLTNRVLKDPRQRRFFKSNDLFELFTLGTADKGKSTETSAIFAGTGSEVRPDAPRSKASIGPLTKLGRSKGAAEEAADRRRKRAEVIQREMLQRKQARNERLGIKVEADGGSGYVNGAVSSSVSASHSFHSNSTSFHASQGDRTAVSETHSLNQASEERDTMSPPKRQRLNSTDREHSCPEDPHPSNSLSGVKKKKLKSSAEKRRRKKDAKIDGQRIPHLAKHRTFIPKKEEEEEETAKNADQDNYVLQKLFKKSGVHSALQHDNIMQSANPDFVLVENEADRVAKEAANAVRLSRRHCHRASSGIPTWTGAAGGSQGATPRFGVKKNSKLVDNTVKQNSTEATPAKKKLFGSKKMFGGDMATASDLNADTDEPADMPSSSSLLARMRARNHLQDNRDDGDNDSDNDDDDFRVRSRGTPMGTEHDDLMMQMVDFVSNQSRIPGQASTDELLEAFVGKIEKSNSALFRSMLRQVCTFHRSASKEGVWRLKADFL
ncbi:DNA excision repair protein ERCC-6-like [Diadema antillarum]|uniref:DNA excision repair protein ERCC-6-like n=1 Tax=Diadema antillarum TaxID=105358 RepID=UPI003A86E9C2